MIAIEASDPVEELQRENEVTERLLERLLEEAQRLRGGQPVPTGEISAGLRLLGQYLRLHVARLDLGLMPEAREVAMQTCFAHLDKIVEDHLEERRLLDEAKAALLDHEKGRADSSSRLAEALERLTQRDHEVGTYEGDYPLSCLVTALPEEASKRVAEQFAPTHRELADLDAHIERHLSSAGGKGSSLLAVHCAHEGCEARDGAHVVPGPGGRLELVAPIGGWRVSSQKVVPYGNGTVRIRVDFQCPRHASVAPGADLDATSMAVWADDGGPVGPSSIEGGRRPSTMLRPLAPVPEPA